jgi:hypothetical protein
VVDPINDARLAQFVVGSHTRRWGGGCIDVGRGGLVVRGRGRARRAGSKPTQTDQTQCMKLNQTKPYSTKSNQTKPTKPTKSTKPNQTRPPSHPSLVPLDPELAAERAQAQEAGEDGALPQGLLRKYITYAKQNCRPQLTQAGRAGRGGGVGGVRGLTGWP